MKHFIILLLAALSLVGCKIPIGNRGPVPFAAFIYTEDGDNYLDQAIDEPLEFYILNEGGVKSNSMATRVEFRDSTILNTVDTFNVKTIPREYYLKVSDDIDTFFIERKGNDFKTVLFNGEEFEWRYEPELHFFATKR